MVKRKINEAYDVSADLYQWFNKYCCDILDTDGNNIDDLRFDLEEANMNVLVDEASDSLVADFGWDADSIYEYKDQIEYDLEQLISDALEYIETGYDRGMSSFDKNKTDWMDRYRDNDEYSASLESHNGDYKMDKKKLESRITRLEKLFTQHRHMKNEEAYADDAEGQLDRLFDVILDCKDDLEDLANSNKEIKNHLGKASVALDKALDSVGKALDFVQSM